MYLAGIHLFAFLKSLCTTFSSKRFIVGRDSIVFHDFKKIENYFSSLKNPDSQCSQIFVFVFSPKKEKQHLIILLKKVSFVIKFQFKDFNQKKLSLHNNEVH